jgi:hypothetical protein
MQINGGVFRSSRNRAERLKAGLPQCLFIVPPSEAGYVIDNIFWNIVLGKPPESGEERHIGAFDFRG